MSGILLVASTKGVALRLLGEMSNANARPAAPHPPDRQVFKLLVFGRGCSLVLRWIVQVADLAPAAERLKIVIFAMCHLPSGFEPGRRTNPAIPPPRLQSHSPGLSRDPREPL